MKKLLVVLALLGAFVSQPLSHAAPNEEASTVPKVGDLAPDFTLNYVDSTGMHNVSLTQYRGKQQVVLAFYIFAFTGG